jgi:hypothetical protein
VLKLASLWCSDVLAERHGDLHGMDSLHVCTVVQLYSCLVQRMFSGGGPTREGVFSRFRMCSAGRGRGSSALVTLTCSTVLFVDPVALLPNDMSDTRAGQSSLVIV